MQMVAMPPVSRFLALIAEVPSGAFAGFLAGAGAPMAPLAYFAGTFAGLETNWNCLSIGLASYQSQHLDQVASSSGISDKVLQDV